MKPVLEAVARADPTQSSISAQLGRADGDPRTDRALGALVEAGYIEGEWEIDQMWGGSFWQTLGWRRRGAKKSLAGRGRRPEAPASRSAVRPSASSPWATSTTSRDPVLRGLGETARGDRRARGGEGSSPRGAAQGQGDGRPSRHRRGGRTACRRTSGLARPPSGLSRSALSRGCLPTGMPEPRLFGRCPGASGHNTSG